MLPIYFATQLLRFFLLTLYGAVLHICNILFSTLLFSVFKLISLSCVFIAIFKLLLVRPHFLNYFFVNFARVMVGERETQSYVPFLLWYCIESWAFMVVIFLIFLTQYMVHCISTVNFIQTLSHTKSQITKLICCIYATLPHSGYENAIILNFFKGVVERFFLSAKCI